MRKNKFYRRAFAARAWLVVLAIFFGAPPAAADEGGLQVLGYGVQGCDAYLAAFDGWEQGGDAGIIEYARYREWFAGLVTGLTLAVGVDVLAGTDVEAAMRRLQVDCDERRESDFFGAAMRLVRLLSGAGGDDGEAPVVKGQGAK